MICRTRRTPTISWISLAMFSVAGTHLSENHGQPDGGSPAAAYSGISKSAAARHGRHGGYAHDGRGHSGFEFIVFLRPVKSRILFEQMLGRGTRKGEHFPDKSHFVVFDCFDGTLLEYFKNATAITPSHPTRKRGLSPSSSMISGAIATGTITSGAW